MLWDKDYQMRTAIKPFNDGFRDYPRGSLIVLIGRNQQTTEEVQADMQEVAEAAQVQIVGMNTGRMASGIDLTSRNAETLIKPKAAMLVDPLFSVYTAGQLWFLFERDTEFPISRLRGTTLRQTSLPKLGRRFLRINQVCGHSFFHMARPPGFCSHVHKQKPCE